MKGMKLPRAATWVAVAVLALVVVPLALADATNSTTDPGQTVGGQTSGNCVRPSAATPVNCNEYAQKQDVFLNGSPSKSDSGTYFFAVLVPGGQPDPNDGSFKNLSDTTCDPYAGCPGPTNQTDGTPIPSGDATSNREFSVDSLGNITNLGNHVFDANGNGGKGSLSVYPFDDTTNNGGVYILAVCKISDSQNTQAIAVPTVKGSDCKYDAFKVQAAPPVIPTASDLVVTKDASGSNTETWTWGIQKAVDQTEIDTSNGSATFNYTVTVTHDSGTISDVQVNGTIQVFNPNVDASNNVVPVDITSVTDQLSDGTNCTVTNGGAQTLTQEETDFTYSCDLSSLPQGELDNTVTVDWPTQLLSNGATLDGNSADFTFTDIAFDQTNVDDCVSVSDTLGGTLGTVCSSDPSPTTFQYPITFTGDPAGTCTTHDNTATFTANTTGTTDSAGQEVKQCVGEDLGVSKDATPSFTRSYTWHIKKAVDKTYVENNSGSATFNYTVTVNHDPAVDSGWQVNGTITVTNPNDWEDITADVTDAIDNGGSCSVTGGTDATIPAGKSVDFPYSCTYSSAPSPAAFTNTGTASWDGTAASTPDSSADGTATGAFGAPSTTTDECVSVSDPADPNSPHNYCVGDTGDPTFSFKYSHTVTAPASTCNTFDNTATFTTNDTGTQGSDSKHVQYCNFGPRFTPGYWKNHLADSTSGHPWSDNSCTSTALKNAGGSCSTQGPFVKQWANSTQWKCLGGADNCSGVVTNPGYTGYKVDTILKAAQVFGAMSCSFSGNAANQNQQAIGCLAGKLLAAKYNVNINGSNTCINPTINQADAFLAAIPKSPSSTISYSGTSGTYTGITLAARATAIALQNTLDAYDNGGGCH